MFVEKKDENKITIGSLFFRFKGRVSFHFFFTMVLMFFRATLNSINSKLFERKEISFLDLFPDIKILRSLLIFFIKDKKSFIFVAIFFVLSFALLYYVCDTEEEKLMVEGNHYIKNLLLDKFRKLSFEEKKKEKDKIQTLIKNDVLNIGYYWEHLPNHVFHCVILVIFSISFDYNKWKILGKKAIVFSFFWMMIVNLLSFFLTSLVIKINEEYRKKLDNEWGIINKETNNSNLIDAMGLTSHFQKQQKEVTLSNKDYLLKRVNFIQTLNKTIPSSLLIRIFPYLLFWLSNNFFGNNLLILWIIFQQLSDILSCFFDYSDLKNSLKRVNLFLSLPEDNYNLDGVIFSNDILMKSITFSDVSFFYSGKKKAIENYSKTFSYGNINYLLGPNGTGKSTILYLILGLIVPSKGEIILETMEGKKYNIHKDINLCLWREKNIAYCSHDNLVEKGSTGQKQLENIKEILEKKKDCQIILFDEAGNALDKKNKKEVETKIEKLVEQRKIIISVEHNKIKEK